MTEKKKVYISYCRSADTSFIQKLINATEGQSLHSVDSAENAETVVKPVTWERISEEALKPETHWQVVFDENGTEIGHTIDQFMDELSEQEHIVILLSEAYFKSLYCLTELFRIYHKRHECPLPIVVFVENYPPKNVELKKIRAHLLQISREKSAEGNQAAAQYCEKLMTGLPLVLTWLLGHYDYEKDNVDALQIFEASNDNAVNEVIDSLRQVVKLKFPHFSKAVRKLELVSEIKKLLDSFGSSDSQGSGNNIMWAVKKLKLKVDQSENINNTDFAGYLVGQMESASGAARLLENFVYWVEEIEFSSEFASLKSAPINFGEVIERLLGWLLVITIDEVKLTQFIHKLNRMDPAPFFALSYDDSTAFQILVSTIGKVPVIYERTATTGLKGKGELRLLERGATASNYTKLIKSEYKVFDGLISRVDEAYSQSDYQDAPKSVLGQLKKTFRKSKHFYLVLDIEYQHAKGKDDFRKYMYKELPFLKIIELQERKDTGGAQSVQSLLRTKSDEIEFDTGTLKAEIRDTYKATQTIQS